MCWSIFLFICFFPEGIKVQIISDIKNLYDPAMQFREKNFKLSLKQAFKLNLLRYIYINLSKINYLKYSIEI